jgi:hypothetical protein
VPERFWHNFQPVLAVALALHPSGSPPQLLVSPLVASGGGACCLTRRRWLKEAGEIWLRVKSVFAAMLPVVACLEGHEAHAKLDRGHERPDLKTDNNHNK